MNALKEKFKPAPFKTEEESKILQKGVWSQSSVEVKHGVWFNLGNDLNQNDSEGEEHHIPTKTIY